MKINIDVNVEKGKEFIWTPSNCNCESDKLYDIGKHLDYRNCKCRRKIIG